MMKDDALKSVPAPHAPLVSSPQELTCTEGQLEDLLAEGETTESETDRDEADGSIEQIPTNTAKRKSPPGPQSNKK